MAPVDPGGRGTGWPAPEVGKELRVDRDELEEIAQRLQHDLDTYSSGSEGTLDDLQSRGNVTIQQLGNYPAAQGYLQSLVNANKTLAQAYREFELSYQGVINAIRESKRTYDDAEDNTEYSANRLRADAGDVQPQTGRARSMN